jgi:ABC-type transporter Mla subunit MlaD
MDPGSTVSSAHSIDWWPTQADHDSAISKLAESQQASSHLVNRVIGLVEALAENVGQIADAQRLAEEKIAGLAQRMDELARAQKHSDERVDRMIDVVEDVIRRQGPPPPVQ